MNHSHNSIRGFSLTESAITLGILAIVLGGIWVAVASVDHSQKVNDAYSNMAMLVSNIQRLYRGTGKIGNTANFTNDNMIKAGAVPARMVDENGDIKSVWMTDITLSAPTSTEFKIEYKDLTEQNCRRLISKIAGRDHNETLIEIKANGNSFTSTGATDNIRGLLATDSTLSGCNKIELKFGLR
jgi:type II secretory pathway pseudopilin PulG